MREIRDNKTCCVMYAVTVLVAVIGTLGAGCQQLGGGWPGSTRTQQPSYKQAYGPTPRQRIEALEQLAARAATMNDEEQLTTASELTSTYQAERDPLIRRAIVRALGALPGNYADEVLFGATNDNDSRVRLAACNAWARRPESANAISVLQERISVDQDPDVRMAAVDAIASLNSQSSLAVLGTALDHTDPAVRSTVVAALQRVSGKDFGADREAWQQYANSLPRAVPSQTISSSAGDRTQFATQQSNAAIQTVSGQQPIGSSGGHIQR